MLCATDPLCSECPFMSQQPSEGIAPCTREGVGRWTLGIGERNANGPAMSENWQLPTKLDFVLLLCPTPGRLDT